MSEVPIQDILPTNIVITKNTQNCRNNKMNEILEENITEMK